MDSFQELELVKELGAVAVKILNNGSLKNIDPERYFIVKDAAVILMNGKK